MEKKKNESTKTVKPAAKRKEADFDMGMPAEQLSRKEQKAIDRKNKEIRKKYHVSNWEILKNFKNYSESEKRHYRYVFGRRVAEGVWPFFHYIILIGLSFIILYPILYMLTSSVKPQFETADPSIMWIPKTIRLQNFVETFRAMKYPEVFSNTVLINVGCSVIQVVTCSIAGYGFARFKFRGRGPLFGIVILQMIVPVQIILIPLYVQFRYFDIFGIFNAIGAGPLNLVDNPIALFMQAFFCNGIRAGLFILLFRQFFRGLPKELEDAAHLDGCGPISTFVRIMIPNALNSYLTVFIFSVVWYWNDSYVSGMFFNGSDTIALAVDNLWRIMSQYFLAGRVEGGPTQFIVWVQAGCLMALFPILLMYIFLQKYFVEGIERSGIVG
ncbi:MAG: carbohydrate ABC transporter permease [Oscillospiraceae bacterium]|jgi:multiple sugar transport system permease protein|nr:carbohydrate ABC transporter permease [Oscillospiraceae bacterium]